MKNVILKLEHITWIDSDMINFLVFIIPFGNLNLRGTPSEGSCRPVILCRRSVIAFDK